MMVVYFSSQNNDYIYIILITALEIIIVICLKSNNIFKLQK